MYLLLFFFSFLFQDFNILYAVRGEKELLLGDFRNDFGYSISILKVLGGH